MDIVPAAQQVGQMMSVFKQMRDLSDPGPTPGEAWRYEQEQDRIGMAYKERQRRFSETKDLMSMMLGNYQKASKDPFLQQNIQQSMIRLQDSVDSVDPKMGEFLRAFTRNTPGSRDAYEQTMWLNANPAPPVTASWEEDPFARAAQEFHMADWRGRFGKLFGGVEAPKATLLPTGRSVKEGEKDEMLYAFRGDDGAVRLMTDRQLGTRGIAKDLGISEGELITNGGHFGQARTVSINGETSVSKPFTPLSQLIAPSKDGPQRQMIQLKNEIKAAPESKAEGRAATAMNQLRKDFLALQADDSSNDLAQAVRLANENGMSPQRVIDEIFKPRYADIPGLQFSHEGEFDEISWFGEKWAGLYGFYTDGVKGAFRFFQSFPLTTEDGKPVPFALRKTQTGETYLVDAKGNPVKNPNTIIKKHKIKLPGR